MKPSPAFGRNQNERSTKHTKNTKKELTGKWWTGELIFGLRLQTGHGRLDDDFPVPNIPVFPAVIRGIATSSVGSIVFSGNEMICGTN
ncbi:MAG: hypothetical protein HY290_11420 [Planctomycetia bacterium]|nr:hypothetical protein [Planctomycetia bacterium]